MQQIRSTFSLSRKRTTLSAEERMSFALACEGSESIESTSGLSISQGWMWMWASNTGMCLLSVGSCVPSASSADGFIRRSTQMDTDEKTKAQYHVIITNRM